MPDVSKTGWDNVGIEERVPLSACELMATRITRIFRMTRDFSERDNNGNTEDTD